VTEVRDITLISPAASMRVQAVPVLCWLVVTMTTPWSSRSGPSWSNWPPTAPRPPLGGRTATTCFAGHATTEDLKKDPFLLRSALMTAETVQPLRPDSDPAPLPEVVGGFKTVLADPPWRFTNRTGKVAPEHRRLDRYSTMTLAAIKDIEVAEVAAKNAHLYLWVPNALLPDGLACDGGPGGSGTSATSCGPSAARTAAPTVAWRRVLLPQRHRDPALRGARFDAHARRRPAVRST
jgi:hypothetical protein